MKFIKLIFRTLLWSIFITLFIAVVYTQYLNLSLAEAVTERQNYIEEIQQRQILWINQQIHSMNTRQSIQEIYWQSQDLRNKTLAESIKSVEKSVTEANQKPSYKYLKSVTVVIQRPLKEWALFGDDEAIKLKNIEGTRVAQGTGVIIKITDDYTYILTNAHVVGEEELPEIWIIKGGRKVNAEVLQIHRYLDLALLRIAGVLPHSREIIGLSMAGPQDEVFMVGHHAGKEYTYGEGVFAGYQGMYSLVQIPTLFGNSGSGIFNKQGHLVGMIFAIQGGKDQYGTPFLDVAHGLAIDGTSIISFLSNTMRTQK